MYRDAFTDFPILRTERLVLRKPTEHDVDGMKKYVKDQEFLKFTDYPPDFEDNIMHAINTWNNEAYKSGKFIRWCIALRENDTCIGGIYLFDPVGDDKCGRRMEIGYEISTEYRKCGYAAEAIQKITSYGFEQMGLKRIQALIIPENIASRKACEKCGYINEGTLKNYRYYPFSNTLRNMVMMACISSDI